MNDIEIKARKAAYMREYRASNRDRLRDEASAKRKAIKTSDPAAYEAERASANARNRKYAEAHREEIRNRAKAINHRYTPERGKKLRSTYKYPLKGASARAKKLGLPFDLTMDWYESQVERGCAATGIPFATGEGRHQSPWYPHIDRIEPALGYVAENCRLVCACFNTAKFGWSDADVLTMAKALVAKNSKE